MFRFNFVKGLIKLHKRSVFVCHIVLQNVEILTKKFPHTGFESVDVGFESGFAPSEQAHLLDTKSPQISFKYRMSAMSPSALTRWADLLSQHVNKHSQVKPHAVIQPTARKLKNQSFALKIKFRFAQFFNVQQLSRFFASFTLFKVDL